MRRSLVLPLALALCAGGLSLPAAAAKKPVKKPPAIPTCPSFTDPAKDDSFDGSGFGEDPALDIINTKMVVDKGALSVTLTMAKGGLPTTADGGEYSGSFTLGGKEVTLFGNDTRSKPVMDVGFAMTGIRVAGSYVSGTEALVTIAVDAAKGTATVTAPLSAVSDASGTKAVGTVKGLTSMVRASQVALLFEYDASENANAALPFGGCKA